MLKINRELNQIWRPTQEDTYRARVKWAGMRGRRIEYLEELRNNGVTGKDYSDAVAEWDRTKAHEMLK